MIKELDLLEVKNIRDKHMDKVDVLEKVKHLLLLPNTEFATVGQVAEYYEVGIEAIRTVAKRHKEELQSDGVKSYKRDDVERLVQDEPIVKIIKTQTHMELIVEDSIIKVSNRGVALFPKRAILRVGMLLRDSKVAKEVRTQLLNIVHDTENQSLEIITNIVNELTEEQVIQLEIGQAIATGDINALAIASTKLSQLKNKRIAELEPKAEYHDSVLRPDKLVTVTDISKDLGMSAIKLNGKLHDKGVQFKQGRSWKLYAKYEHLVPEYADYHITEYNQLLKWTEKGRKWIIELLEAQ